MSLAGPLPLGNWVFLESPPSHTSSYWHSLPGAPLEGKESHLLPSATLWALGTSILHCHCPPPAVTRDPEQNAGASRHLFSVLCHIPSGRFTGPFLTSLIQIVTTVPFTDTLLVLLFNCTYLASLLSFLGRRCLLCQMPPQGKTCPLSPLRFIARGL